MKKRYKTRVWHPFMGFNYRYEWRSHKLIGVMRELGRDIRRCHERIWRGYCDYDIFEIDTWFLHIMPVMLLDFRDHTDCYPGDPEIESRDENISQVEQDSAGMKAWKDVLDQMIFLMREADEETCGRKNSYEDEFDRINAEFEEEFGPFGEKLRTEKENTGPSITWHMANEIPEYKPTWDRYMDEETNLMEYRQKCKDEALELFSKWFYCLWD